MRVLRLSGSVADGAGQADAVETVRAIGAVADVDRHDVRGADGPDVVRVAHRVGDVRSRVADQERRHHGAGSLSALVTAKHRDHAQAEDVSRSTRDVPAAGERADFERAAPRDIDGRVVDGAKRGEHRVASLRLFAMECGEELDLRADGLILESEVKLTRCLHLGRPLVAEHTAVAGAWAEEEVDRDEGEAVGDGVVGDFQRGSSGASRRHRYRWVDWWDEVI